MTLVADSTPLIALGRIQALDLLRDLAGDVLVPPAVAEEVFCTPVRGAELPFLESLPWITVASPAEPGGLTYPATLGRGEREAIALAQERGLPLLTDDLAAGRFARQLGISVTRTLALLLVAEERGLIPDAELLVRSLVENGFRLHPSVLSLFRSHLAASRTRRGGHQLAA